MLTKKVFINKSGFGLKPEIARTDWRNGKPAKDRCLSKSDDIDNCIRNRLGSACCMSGIKIKLSTDFELCHAFKRRIFAKILYDDGDFSLIRALGNLNGFRVGKSMIATVTN